MRIIYGKDGHQRSTADQLSRIYVVTEAGRIKTLYIERNVRSPALACEEIRKQGRVIGFSRVMISSEYAELGWSMLEDLYRAEDRMGDWEAFLSWQDAARQRVVDPLPDEYLPDEVLRRRAQHPAKARRVDLPPPQRKAKAKGGAS